MPNKPEK
jgi:hypothetical protein